ncbi:MAG: ankyrin repeat domain-containing protein [Verrucomicrobium sp.]|nr:ankyrin repeat domain-containing protein [Verrucomicrobium sp.]
MDAPIEKIVPLPTVATSTRLRSAILNGELPALTAEFAFSREHFLSLDGDGYYPLVWAAQEGCLPQVASAVKEAGQRLILEDFLTPTRFGDSSVHPAALTGHLDQIAAVVKESGQRLTLEHLLAGNGSNSSPLYWAAHGGHLDQVAALLKDSGETLAAEHFLAPNASGKTPLIQAAEHDNLRQVFQPSLWHGRVPEMLRLWCHVPEENRSQIDFPKITRQTLFLSRTVPPRLDPDAFRAASRPAIALPTRETPVREHGQ